MRKLVLIVAACACTAQGGVFDDAMAWWTFDHGGADGTVATKAQLGDARDASLHQPSTLYGKDGGPTWSEMDVRLPYQRRTVHGTALHFPCEVQNVSTTQCWYTSMAFSNLYTHDPELTIVARVRIESNGIQAADCMIWNNAFSWGADASKAYGVAMGVIKWNNGKKGSEVTYGPYGFIGRNYYGNGTADRAIPMKVGEWYDVAYLISEETVGGTRYDLLTFVVADASGIRTQTFRKPSQRVTPGTTTHARMSAMTPHTRWYAYNNANLSKNTGDEFKNFEGWIHQLAVWKRRLSLDEVKEAFGRPAAHPEQDIYADAVNWIRFDKDIDGDGKVNSDEVRDVRHWNAPSNGQPVAVSQSGPLGGPIWTNMTVDLPGRGVSIKSPCLYFPIATNVTHDTTHGTVCQGWPTTLRFGNMMRSGSYTIMARIYPLWQPCAIPNVSGYIYNNGLDWSIWAGGEFGVNGYGDRSGNSFCPVMTLAHGSYTAGDLKMYTNNWYDIAYSIKDNGVDADGNTIPDTAIVAIQDVAKGFRYQTFNIGTNAYTVYSDWRQRAMLGSEAIYYAQTDHYYPDTGTQSNYGNSVKAFNGMIHEVVVWNRALTTNEIAAAFSHPCNMVMQAGSADGSASEFAGAEGAYDANVDATGTVWRAISNILNADHPELTLRFTPEKNNVKLVHYLHLKSADVGTADGQKARLNLLLNGEAVDEAAQEVGAFEDRWYALPRKALRTGENVLTIAYVTGGSAASFALDSVAITGSWQLGKQDGGVAEFSQEGDNVTPNFIVGDRNLKHVSRAVTSGWNNNYHAFYVPAHLATNHTFTFTSAITDYNAPLGTNLANACTIDLNGTVKYKTPAANLPAKRTPFSFKVERGELKPGWNTLHLKYTGTVRPGWVSFDFFKLEISDYHTGSVLIIR